MSRYMETLYLGSGNDGYKTLVGAEFESSEETTQAFESFKVISVDIKIAEFLLDLKEDDGTIIETIGLDSEGYKNITGKPVLREEEYCEIDRKFWASQEAMCELKFRNGFEKTVH